MENLQGPINICYWINEVQRMRIRKIWVVQTLVNVLYKPYNLSWVTSSLPLSCLPHKVWLKPCTTKSDLKKGRERIPCTSQMGPVKHDHQELMQQDCHPTSISNVVGKIKWWIQRVKQNRCSMNIKGKRELTLLLTTSFEGKMLNGFIYYILYALHIYHTYYTHTHTHTKLDN